MVYTTEERVEIIELFFGNNRCAYKTAQVFIQCDANRNL